MNSMPYLQRQALLTKGKRVNKISESDWGYEITRGNRHDPSTIGCYNNKKNLHCFSFVSKLYRQQSIFSLDWQQRKQVQYDCKQFEH